jgi:hypothetical protein
MLANRGLVSNRLKELKQSEIRKQAGYYTKINTPTPFGNLKKALNMTQNAREERIKQQSTDGVKATMPYARNYSPSLEESFSYSVNGPKS